MDILLTFVVLLVASAVSNGIRNDLLKSEVRIDDFYTTFENINASPISDGKLPEKTLTVC